MTRPAGGATAAQMDEYQHLADIRATRTEIEQAYDDDLITKGQAVALLASLMTGPALVGAGS